MSFRRPPARGTLPFGGLFLFFGLVAIGMGAFMLGLRLPFGWLWRGEVRDVVAADGMRWTAYPRPLGARLWDVAGPVIGAAFALLFVALALPGRSARRGCSCSSASASWPSWCRRRYSASGDR